MRIISFAIWFVPPFFRTVFVLRVPLSVRREEILYAYPCVSFRLIRNTGTNSGRCHSGTAIYAGVEVLLSRPILGHTPRKLPPCGAISRFIAFVNAPGCVALRARVPAYNNREIPICQGDFSIISKFFAIFVRTAKNLQRGRPRPSGSCKI